MRKHHEILHYVRCNRLIVSAAVKYGASHESIIGINMSQMDIYI